MSHAPTADGFPGRRNPPDLRIPAPPRAVRRDAAARPAESWWREAMRWSLIGLTASWAAGEVTLFLILR